VKAFRRCMAPAVLALGLLAVPPTGAPAVTIDWVTVGDPGNAADTSTYGAVGSVYRVGRHEVTIRQYADFLNAVARSDPHALYNTAMGSDVNVAGITRTGTSGAYSYGVIDNGGSSANRPIAYVSWFDAARFANWMENGQGNGDTETGAYTLNGATSGAAVAKNPGATFFVPSEDEWYKAAFYSAAKAGPGTPGYWTYATQSDAVPGNTVGAGANQVNYYIGAYPNGAYATGGGTYTPSQNYLTDVGAYTGSASFYGTFDQSGGVYEWNDLDGSAGSTRGLRGGSWYNGGANGVSTTERLLYDPASEIGYIGFRLASTAPELDPAGVSAVLALVGGMFGLVERRRRGSTMGERGA